MERGIGIEPICEAMKGFSLTNRLTPRIWVMATTARSRSMVFKCITPSRIGSMVYTHFQREVRGVPALIFLQI